MDKTHDDSGSRLTSASFSPRLRFRVGLERAGTSYWAEPAHEAALVRMIEAAATAKGAA